MSYDINLGPFNGCVEIVDDPNSEFEYQSKNYGNKLVYYESDDVVSEMALTGEVATVPTFLLEDSVPFTDIMGNVSLLSTEKQNIFINRFELKIIEMIHNLSRFSKVDFVDLDTSRIVIPIRHQLEIHQRDVFLCGTLHLGLAFFT